MKRTLAVMLLVSLLTPTALADQSFMPEKERRILELIADEMKLNQDETDLLLAIRKIEDGKPGKECGVLYTMDGAELRPYKFWPLSLMENGCLCAVKIKRRYRGRLKPFAAWYAPVGADNDPRGLNKDWLPMVKQYMRQLKKERQ
jgi:hypothetical protein